MKRKSQKNYNKQKSKRKDTAANTKANKTIDKKFINSKYKYRGNAAVQLLKKQIDLEKRYLTQNVTAIQAKQAVDTEESEEEDEYHSLVQELKTTAKKHKPSFKETSGQLMLLNAKNKSDCIEENIKLNSDIVNNSADDDVNDGRLESLAAFRNRYKEHLSCELNADDVEKLLKDDYVDKNKETYTWPSLGQIYMEQIRLSLNENNINGSSLVDYHHFSPVRLTTIQDLQCIGIQSSLAQKLLLPLTVQQSELFSLLNIYKDVYYPERNLENGEDIRFVYTLHAFNHIKKARALIKLNDRKLKDVNEEELQPQQIEGQGEAEGPCSLAKNNNRNYDHDDNDDDKYRDQGLAKPKVLILVPFRDSAYCIVNIMANLIKSKLQTTTSTTMENEQKTVMNYKRFVEEYTGNELYFPKAQPKPEDYEKTFKGNTDDNFRLGLALTEKTLKIYTEFHESDILLASPLGLRMTIAGSNYHNNDNNDKNNSNNNDINYDYLSSIEILIIDQADIILAQNWENVIHIMEHLHLQPLAVHNNIMRVRSWCLNGFTKFYRQSLIFASHDLPEFRGIFNNKCFNYYGKVRIINPIRYGAIRNVYIPLLSHQFHRINNLSANGQTIHDIHNKRFEYFTIKILPKFRNTLYAHTMIYVPNYFDYIKLRNHMKTENYNFVQICEYTKKEKMARARDMFYHSSAHFLLYSERSHFFKRTRIKGIRHMIMYQPPMYPQFYSEMINLMHSSYQNCHDGLNDSMSITILYTKYDQLQLNSILGSEYTAVMLASDKLIHVYVPQT